MSWIDDELNKAREEDEDRRLREQNYSQQVPRFWNELVEQVSQDVAEMNRNEELRRRRHLGDHVNFENLGSTFAVSKLVFPAVYLRVTNDGKSLSVQWEVVTYEQSMRSGGGKKTRTTLTFGLDTAYRLHLKDKDGTVLTLPEASRYLLTPLLNTQP